MMEELGSGFYLAMHDLEIRGAGEVLGENAVGRDAGGRLQPLQRDAQRAVRALKAGREPDLDQPLSSLRDQPARPGAAARGLLRDVHERLTLYKRLANCERRRDLRLSGPERLRLQAAMPGWTDRARAVRELLGAARRVNLVLQGPAAGAAGGGAARLAARADIEQVGEPPIGCAAPRRTPQCANGAASSGSTAPSCPRGGASRT
jgi:hypothetical protein